MPDLKFPPTVEIKRAIAAVERAGITIDTVEIHPRKIIIIAKSATDDEPKQLTYAEWKAERGL